MRQELGPDVQSYITSLMDYIHYLLEKIEKMKRLNVQHDNGAVKKDDTKRDT